MMNTEGRQPMSEQAPLWDHRAHPDNPNQQRRTLEKGHVRGMRAIQHGGPALMKRTGYIVDSYRLNPKQRMENMVFQEQIIKIVEDQLMMRHIALVCGRGKPRWIPATKDMKVGQVLTNDSRAELPADAKVKNGNAHVLSSLPLGTEVCMVEEFPGSGARFATSNNRYGIITGRIGREGHNSLISISFPYASPEGIKWDDDTVSKVNYKGVLDKDGLHSRMGGDPSQDIIMEDGTIKLNKKAARNQREQPANMAHGPWESYFQSMWTHREHTADQNPQSLYDQDVALSGNCVAVIGRASHGGAFNAQLLAQTPTDFKLFGGEVSNGLIGKEIRSCGKQHISLHFRRFKRAPGQLVNVQGNQFVLLSQD